MSTPSSQEGNAGWANALNRAEAHSPFLAQMMRRHSNVTALLAEGAADSALDLALAIGEGAEGAAQILRWRRGAVALVTGVSDLAGAWDLERVTHTLSDFADSAVEAALAAAFAERYPGEEQRGFAVIALGKHGSRELNYSSDIDPILLFDPATLPCRAREEPVESAVRLAKRMVELLAARDGDGYVFRVDLRLRPSPEATPIALSVDAAISYYESMALGWEQAAFIRARVCAGDRALGEYFLQAIRPFIWRRSLDFGAIDAILDISRRIRDHYASGQAFGPGFDLKRGRGGIREVEFFAQVHQLIHGGRQPALRAGATREAVRLLAQWRVIEPEVAARLDSAYVLLRTIEHRLQMVDDRQTHEIPSNADALDTVARLHGLGDGHDLLNLLRPHIQWVGTNYDRLNPFQAEERLSHDERLLPDQIRALGFTDVAPVVARLVRWRNASARALRSAPAMEALEKLLPDLLRGLAKAPDPILAITRFEQLVERLPTAINFFKLLAANKPIVRLLVEVLSYAPPLAEALSYRVDLLDGLIGASALEPLPKRAELEALLSRLETGDDYQMLLDNVRQKVSERRFALGVQVICGKGSVLEIGAGYGRLAEAAVRVVARATVEEFERTHGSVPGGELVIVALGRLGGGVLTYASDLDLIYLFTGEFSAESDGPKPLGATQYFNRLAQRIGNALSVPTASGPLYEIDTRLRPFGTQGLLAASVDSFARYQRQNAWVWEHLALTRARPLYGSDAACAALNNVIHGVLTSSREEGALIRDAVKMRADMAKHKPAAGPLDVKLADGGLVDLEFLVQVTQLRHHAGLLPDLGASVRALIAAGLLPGELADAHDLLTRYLIVSRLVSPASTEPPEAARALVARRCGPRTWDDLLARLADARQCVAESWGAVVAAGTLEEKD